MDVGGRTMQEQLSRAGMRGFFIYNIVAYNSVVYYTLRMQTLTAIQQAVYDYTRQTLEQGLPFPSLREIASEFGFKHTTARFHLKALEKKGFIRQRSQRVSEYLLASQVVEQQDFRVEELRPGQFRLAARIPAGAPSPIFDESSESFSVNRDFFGGGDIQGIRVAGESMSGDAITDGDIAMIKLQSEANKGDILAVRIEDEITLKRIKLVGDRCQLIPSNPEFSIREVPARHLQIIGKLVGVIRKT
ncbi:MAG: repressor LexA [Gammaproteobacteria bacterium]|nr:MAG: repressor LexA [Gammaproteobacteria bacterium]